MSILIRALVELGKMERHLFAAPIKMFGQMKICLKIRPWTLINQESPNG